MLKRLKKISTEILHSNPWWEYKHDVYEKPNGEPGDYFYGETPGAVVIVPVLEDGRLVLTLQYRYLDDKQSIGFPCGGIKRGVDTLTAAKLELAEETGCVADEWIKLGVFEPSSGFVKDETHVFLAYVLEQREQHLDETEDIEVLYRRPEELEEMMQKNDIWDGQTLAAWTLARQNIIKSL